MDIFFLLALTTAPWDKYEKPHSKRLETNSKAHAGLNFSALIILLFRKNTA